MASAAFNSVVHVCDNELQRIAHMNHAVKCPLYAIVMRDLHSDFNFIEFLSLYLASFPKLQCMFHIFLMSMLLQIMALPKFQ